MTPTFIRSADDFQNAVKLGVTRESETLEFKRKVDTWDARSGTDQKTRQRAQKEVCRDISQFANTWGGCLVIGVEEDNSDDTHRLKVTKAIAPISNVDGLLQWIENAIRNYVVPATFTYNLIPIALPEGPILVVNIPASLHLVSLWDQQKHTVDYLRRTSEGKAWMNPDEAERHLMNGSRAAKLAIHAANGAAGTDRIELPGGF